jgi:hypothetical protein
MYIIFYEFLKNQNLAQNPNVLAFDFTKKREFTTKTDPNSKVLAFSFTENASLSQKLG